MKKFVGLLLSLALCFGTVSALAGCGGNKRKAGEFTVLFMANSSENKFYEAHFKKLEETLGVKIKYEGIASKDYYGRLTAEINGNTTPDIMYIRPSDVRQFVRDGVIANINAEAAAQTDADLSKLYPSALESYRYNRETHRIGSGDLYALPKDLSAQQLGYNKTIIEKKRTEILAAGIAKLPWEMNWETENYTWEELKTMAQICTDLSDIANPVYGMDVPNIEVLIWGYGGSLLSEDMQTVQGNSQAVKNAVRMQAELMSSGAANAAGATYDNFVANRVAFYGEVNSFNIKDFEDTSKANGWEWDVMPWPTMDKSQPGNWTGVISSAGFAVCEDCLDKTMAVRIIASLLTEQTQEKLVKDEKLMLPLYKSVAEQAFISSDYDDIYAPLHRKVYIDVISGAHGKFSVNYRCYNTNWRKDFNDYLEELWAAKANEVEGKLKSDAQYDAMNAAMQSLYNEVKDR